MSLQLRIVQETSFFISSYAPIEKRRIIVSTTDQVTTNRHAIITLVLRQDAWYTVLGNTRHVQVIGQNYLYVPKLTPTAAARSSTDWERLAHINIETSSILRSVQTVCGQPVRTLSSKLSLPCEKRRCHLNTTLRLNASSP